MRGRECLSAQQGRMTVDKVRGASQELGDSGELVGIEILQNSSYVFSQWVYHVLDVRQLLCQLEDLFAAIVWVRFTTQVSGQLQPRDHTSNRAACPAGDRTEVATSHRSALAQ